MGRFPKPLNRSMRLLFPRLRCAKTSGTIQHARDAAKLSSVETRRKIVVRRLSVFVTVVQ